MERRIGVSNASLDSPPKSYVVVISQSFDLVTSELKWIRLILFLTVPVALALAGLGGWFLARRSLPNERMIGEHSDRPAQFFQPPFHLCGLREIGADIPPDQSQALWDDVLSWTILLFPLKASVQTERRLRCFRPRQIL